MKKLLFLVPLALFGLLAVFLGKGLTLNPREVPSPLIGKPIPAFTAERLEANAAALTHSDMLGRVWVLNVWASWCAPCQEELPALLALARSQPVPIIGLNYKDQRSTAQTWLSRFGNPYALSLFDPQGRLGLDLGVYGVPETFVIDRLGHVRFKHTGIVTDALVKERIAPLLLELQK